MAIGGDACCIARDKIDFLEHICNFSGWEYDEHKHWQSCSCGKTQNEGEHTGDGDTCTVCDAALSAALGSGSIDGGLSWSLSRSGALTISGSGKMPDFHPSQTRRHGISKRAKFKAPLSKAACRTYPPARFPAVRLLKKSAYPTRSRRST